jgi:hypothetical protein
VPKSRYLLSIGYQAIFTDMKLIVEVADKRADFVKELLDSLPFVKTKTITPKKAKFLEELKKSVAEVSLAKQGKLKLQSAREFLNEL